MKEISEALKKRIADHEAKKAPKAIKGLPEDVTPSNRIVHDPTILHGGKIKYQQKCNI